MTEKINFNENAETRRENRLLEVIEKNHKFAELCFQIEQLMAGKEAISKDDPELVSYLAVLPENLKQDFEDASRFYIEERQKTLRYQNSIHKSVEYQKNLGVAIEDTPEDLGPILFKQVARKKPLGRVAWEHREAYFLLSFERDEDYLEIATGAKKEMSGGQYHRAVLMSFYNPYVPDVCDKDYVPVILLRHTENPESAITHERQHFINDKILLNFQGETLPKAEREGTEDYREQASFRVIKDEILAYMRDGSPGSLIKTSLLGELYSHLFEPLSYEDKQKAKQVVEQVTTFLSDNATLLESPESRALLVYQLVHVPLMEIPKWLKELRNYYEKRFEVLKDFDSVRNLNFLEDEIPMLIENVSFPSTYPGAEKLLSEINTIYEEMKANYQSARKTVFNSAVSLSGLREACAPLLQKHAEMNISILDKFNFISRNGVMAPNARESRLCKYGFEDYEAEDGKTDDTKKIKRVVLDEISDLDQKEVDHIFQYLIGKAGKPKSIGYLFTKIKKIVHSFNQSGRCSVHIDIGDAMENTFFIYVTYGATEKDKNEQIKNAQFEINFYNSAFKP